MMGIALMAAGFLIAAAAVVGFFIVNRSIDKKQKKIREEIYQTNNCMFSAPDFCGGSRSAFDSKRIKAGNI